MDDKERQQARTVERLLKDRIIFLGTPIDDHVANLLLAQLLYLLDADSSAPISLYINSPGGSVAASFAILDAMDDAGAPIYTTCVGVAAGTAALILANGTRGCRFALPHASIRLLRLTNSKRESGAALSEELHRLEQLVVGRFASYTMQPEAKVRADLAHEKYLDAYEAKAYGLIDAVVRT